MEQELSRLEKISKQHSLDSLTNQLTLADHLVYKKYLTELQNYGIVYRRKFLKHVFAFF